MRIRFHSYFYPPCVGGGEVILQHQAEGLAARGHEVHVHTTTFSNLNLRHAVAPGSTLEGGVHVHRRASRVLPFHNPLEADAWTSAVWGDAWRAADLLVCVGYPSFHLDALSLRARATGTPLVVQNYVTGDFLREILAGTGGLNKQVRAAYWRRWVRPRLTLAAAVVADSPAAGAVLRSELGLDNVHVHVGMAVDPAEFAAIGPDDIAAVRARLGLGDDRVILAPSRFSHQKGADVLVEAAAPLLTAGGALASGWRVVIPGAVNEPAFAEQVRARSKSLGLWGGGGARPLRNASPGSRDRTSDRVVFAPDAGLPRRELLALFKAAEVVVLPSRGETVGGVVFEGMHAGAVCIVSDAVEAARDLYLRDGENGLLVPSEDVPALRAALLRAATTDTTALRGRARAEVAAHYTWDASVARLETLFEQVRRA